MSIDRLMDKEDVVCVTNIHTQTDRHTHTHIHTVEYYSAIKNNEILLLETWMNLEDIMLREIS